MYSILDESNNQKSTSKGHNAFIEFQEFYDILFKKKILRHIKMINLDSITNENNQ